MDVEDLAQEDSGDSLEDMTVEDTVASADMSDALDAGGMEDDLLDMSADAEMGDDPNARSFFLGFTMWPYAATLEAITDTYQRIDRDADLITHHLMGGIPWDDALAGSAYSESIEGDICNRLRLTYPDDQIAPNAQGYCEAPDRAERQPIYLAVDSLDDSRHELAKYWGAMEREELFDHAPWDTRDFDHPDVAKAYATFASAMITRFKPALFNLGTEASELLLHDAERFARYVIFVQRVVAQLRIEYPDLPMMVSVALKSPGSQDAMTLEASFGDLVKEVEVLGVSVYPYAFFDHADKGDPDNLPQGWFSQVNAYRQNRPIAITETAWIAEDLSIAEYGLSVSSTAARQDRYVEMLLSECEQVDCVLINWFSVVDYDALWEDIPEESQPLSAIWRDSGLYDEALVARPALDRWRSQLTRPIVLP